MLRRRRQELMSEIKQAQDGEANTQINGDGNSITNMIGNVKVSPKGIELKAVVDHFWLSFFIIAAICVLVISTTIYFQLRSLGIFLGVIIGALTVISLEFATTNIMLKYTPWHIVYKDGVIKVGKRERRFYEEIWDMSYRRTIFGNGILTFYAVNPVGSQEPYERKLQFLKAVHAKYVYDSFFDAGRIREFRGSASQEENAMKELT